MLKTRIEKRPEWKSGSKGEDSGFFEGKVSQPPQEQQEMDDNKTPEHEDPSIDEADPEET